MADGQEPPRVSAHSRKFLEKLLADCRRSGWPGNQDLIKQIEEALAKLPPAPSPPPKNPPPNS